MKKSILLILIIITMIFSGGKKVLADETCDVINYTNKCTYKYFDTKIDSFKLYYSEENQKTWIVKRFVAANGNETNYFYYNINGLEDKVFYVNGIYQSQNENCKKNANSYMNGYNFNKIKLTELKNGCPTKIYVRTWGEYDVVSTDYDYRTEYSTTYYNDPEIKDSKKNLTEYGLEAFFVYELTEDENAGLGEEDDDEEYIEPGCQDLIDKELRGYINEGMTYVRIGIPILLIGLIIFDFVTAIFGGQDDKAVKKAKDKAIKRIIIAVVIFFIPTLINFVFDLVNDVWGKNYEICGLEETE